MGWTRDPWNIDYPSLTTPSPFKSQKILFNDRVLGSNLLQPKGDYLHLTFQYQNQCWKPPSQVTQFNPILFPLPSLTFYGPPRSFARFCDTCISSIWPFNTVRAVLLMFQICAALVLIFELLPGLCCTSRTLLSEQHKYHSE